MVKKIAVVSMVRNEADVLESFVRHNLSWADALYLSVHASTDETLAIAHQLRDEGLPLFVYEQEDVAQLQSEVITGLVYQAIDEGADLVVPLDADEFLLPDDMAGSGRQALLSLDAGKFYALSWRRYVPGKGKGFLLARPAKREKHAEVLRKVLIGAEAARKVPVVISQGNHHVLREASLNGNEEPQAMRAELVAGVHVAHYPWRSEAQAEAKIAVGWLANIAKYTRYTRNANHWRDGFQKLLAGRHLEAEPLKEPEKAPPLAGAGAVRLRYTPQLGDREVLRKVLQAAEGLAEAYCEQLVRGEAHIISILLPFKGNIEAFRRSLESAVAADYPYKEYVVYTLLEDEEPLAGLESLLEKQPVERIALLTGAGSVSQMAEALTGEFVQWLPEGTRLLPGRLSKLAACLATQPELGLVLTAVQEGASLKRLREQDKILVFDMFGRKFLSGEGSQAAQAMRDSGQIFAGGLAACFCRRFVFEQQGLLPYLARGGAHG